MSTVVDSLITEYKLHDQYSSIASRITAATRSTGSAITGFTSLLGPAATGLAVLGRGASMVIGSLSSMSTILAGASVAVLGLGAFAMKQAADLEALTLGLQNFTGSAEATARAIERLKEVAKLPGLGFKEAIQGSIALQAVGFDARLAERALMGFGNALATVGRGKADLDGVITALSQIVSKGTVSAEEINQLAERVPQIRQLMIDAFGTTNTEMITKQIGPQKFIKGLIDALENLPKAPNAAKNFFENLGDAAFRSFASIGSVLNRLILPPLQKVVDFITYLTDNGVIEHITTRIAGIFGLGNLSDSAFVKVISYVAATLDEMPNIMKGIAIIFNGLYHNMLELMKRIRDVLVAVGSSWLGRIGGLESLARLGPAGTNPKEVMRGFDSLVNTKGDIEKKAQGYMSGFENPSSGTSKDSSKGGFRVGETLSRIADTNKQIADNTAKQLDLQQTLLGGGAISQQELSGYRVGQSMTGGSGTERKLITILREMMAEEAGGQLVAAKRYGYRTR